MELKVWVDGIQRVVCGVTDNTTCQDVVFALAHATGRTGRFSLVERWRNNDSLLHPQDFPVKILGKWGEHSNDVQFILKHSGSVQSTPNSSALASPSSGQHTQNNQENPHVKDGGLKKSLTFSMGNGLSKEQSSSNSTSAKGRKDVPRGIVKGIPQLASPLSPTAQHRMQQQQIEPPHTRHQPMSNPSSSAGSHIYSGQRPSYIPVHSPHHYSGSPLNDVMENDETRHGQRISQIQSPKYPVPQSHTSPPVLPHISHPVRSPTATSSRLPVSASQSSGFMRPAQPPCYSDALLVSKKHVVYDKVGQRKGEDCLRVTPGGGIENGDGGGLSPNRSASSNLGTPKSRRNVLSEFQTSELADTEFGTGDADSGGPERTRSPTTPSSIPVKSPMSVGGHATTENGAADARKEYDARYKKLVRLVNAQRCKLGSLESNLLKCDAELGFLQHKMKEEAKSNEVVQREAESLDSRVRQIEQELCRLDDSQLQDEVVVSKQQEMTLQSEITLFRSKTSNCESELLQSKNKIRRLFDDVWDQKRHQTEEEEIKRQRDIMAVADLQRELQTQIADKLNEFEKQAESLQQLDNEVSLTEAAILEKKKKMDDLLSEMRAANLESLTMNPGDTTGLNTTHFADGYPNRTAGGSVRKMIGSPRQLENAAPTTKNPHGVWV